MIIKLHDELILILIQSTIVSITACNYLLVILLFIGVIALVFLCGISAFKENILLGIFFIVIGIIMLIGAIKKFNKIKNDIRNKN